MTVYLVEVHDTENDKVGVLTDKDTGEISTFDSYSAAKVQASLLKENLTDNMYTKIVFLDGKVNKQTESE